MAKTWEDLYVGEKVVTKGKTVTQSALDVIVGLTGMTSPLFNDDEYCKKQTPFGGRIGPGPLILLYQGGIEEQVDVRPPGSLLVGLNNVKFMAPLKAGDTLRIETEVVSMRETKNPDKGLVIHKATCLNQKDEVIMETDLVHLVTKKPARKKK